jgi:hypothetical protein
MGKEQPVRNDFRDVFEAWRYLRPEGMKTKWAVLESLGYVPAANTAKYAKVDPHRRQLPSQQAAVEGEGDSDQPQPGSEKDETRKGNWLNRVPVELPPTEAPSLKILATKIREPRLPKISPLENFRGKKLLPAHEVTKPPPELTPLFRSSLMRSIYTHLLAIRSAEGQFDVKEIVTEVAQKKTLVHVPRLPVTSIARGAQILIDISDAMLPFRQDTREIESDIGDLFGTDSIRVMYFANNPMRGAGIGSRRRWRRYSEAWPPLERTRILVITDLGIGYSGSEVPSGVVEWLDFASYVSRRDCPLTFLTPYSANRWPPILAKRLKIIHWDPSTTSAIISRHT